jgi:uncharacterized membrane protein
MTTDLPGIGLPDFMALLSQLVAALVMISLPHIARREQLFGVPVPEGFRATEPGRFAIRSYRSAIAAATGIAVLGTIWMANSGLVAAGTLLIVAGGTAAFAIQNRNLKPNAIEPSQVREVEVNRPERLPWFVLPGIVPILLLAASAAFLHSHWDRIPERFPIHFTFNGTPNGWTDRTVQSVYGPLIVGSEISVVLLALGLTRWFGSRRPEPIRKPALIMMLAVEWTVGFVFAAIQVGLACSVPIPISLIVFLAVFWMIPAITYAISEASRPSGPTDPRPNECWEGGIIYDNPNDTALFVERRIGFILNIPNHWCLALLCGGLLAIILVEIFL